MMKFKILLIEDDLEDAEYLIELLKLDSKNDFKLTHSITLHDGLVEYGSSNFDVVLLDLNLPDISGTATAKKACAEITSTPIIVLTGLNDTHTGIDTMNYGVQDYWVKGEINADSLFDSIQYAITRKNLEENLRQNSDLMLTIFNEIPTSLILVNENREILKINNAGLKLTESTERDIIGVKAGNAIRCINALNAPNGCGSSEFCNECLLRLAIANTFETQKPSRNINMKIPTVNGEDVQYNQIIFSTSLIQSEDQLLVQVSITDITELKAYEHKVERSNFRLESLLKLSQFEPESEQELLDYALQIAIELCESKIGYIYHYVEARQKFILNSWSKEVMHECRVVNPQTEYDLEDTGCWGEAVRQRKPIVINDYSLDHELTKGTPKGHVQLKRFLTIPVFQNKNIVAVVGVANKKSNYDEVDVKQLTLLMDAVWKKVEQERQKSELIEAKERAEESDRLKSTFLAIMSHELRTPLNSVIGFSDLLSEEDDIDQMRAYSKYIHKNGNHLLEIIDQIFMISELESKEITLNKGFITGEEFILLAKLSIEPTIDKTKKNIQLKTWVDEELKEKVIDIDKDRIIIVLKHLISNAWKFTKEGVIEYGMKVLDGTTVFFVSDTGIGLSNNDKDLIFKRFTQLEQAYTREFEGIGLGLNICQKIVELFKGEIWFVSELNKGTTFYFKIEM